MPKMSQTERIALQSGSAGVERLIISGKMTHDSLSMYRPRPLSKNDTVMMERAPQLLATVDEYDILTKRFTPPEHPFWAHAKTNDFFGLIVPEEYNGMQLTNSGLSRLLQRLSSCSASVPVHVMVPASLGPAELLAHYGTDAQKQHFLPRLAEGAIPCFALTSADAGSDAAGSMTDTGTVYLRSDGEVGIRLNCEKRYITLAPVADLIGVAFKLVDPEGLLEQKYDKSVDGEITLALLERGTFNLSTGACTDPLGVGFSNGTVIAKNVEMTVDNVIGGVNGLGQGWKFLMEALAAGRGIALPAGAAGSSKMLTNAVGGYASLRKQFKVPLSDFEGIQEKLADMVVKTFEIDSLVAIMNCVLDNGERPPVMSAISKQRSTELGRDVVMHAMDIVAGSAICMGPQNFVAPAYLSNPIGITVEGSNTMTRSLLIFGQGIVRSHPHLLDIVRSVESDDFDGFRKACRAAILDNCVLMLRPKRRTALERFVHFFALSANASLALGGSLKRREYLSGRYADMLSYILAGFAMEWHAEMQKAPGILLGACAATNLHRLQAVAGELITNHPHGALHQLLYLRTVGARDRFAPPSDDTKTTLVRDLIDPDSQLRRIFAQDVLHIHPNVQRIEAAMRASGDERESLVKEIIRVDTMQFYDQYPKA